MASKVGILLLNLGGPDSPEAVKPFLYNLFSDPDIIKLPLSFVFQKPLAWLISTLRGNEAAQNYQKIGGCSPILPLTQGQLDALKASLLAQGYDIPIYLGMRYWHPMISAAVSDIQADEIDHLIVLPLYPHFSYTTTGSSINELERILLARHSRLDTTIIDPYYLKADYLEALADTIQQGCDNYSDWSVDQDDIQVLFSAHSLPRRHVKRTQDPYPEQIYTCAKTLMDRYFPHNAWDLGFQSKVGKMPWLGPSTDGVLHYYAAQGINNVLIVPISFVSDHIETLFEIDMEYIPTAKELCIAHCHRAPALNSNPLFIRALSNLVLEVLTPLGVNTVCRL